MAELGRPKGSLNRQTEERMERVRLLEQVAQAAGLAPDAAEKVAAVIDKRRPLAREEMEEAVPILKSVVGYFSQSTITVAQRGGNPTKSEWDTLKSWFEFYVDLLDRLAPYQSPTFRAIVVAPAPPASKGESVRRFGLRVFEGGRAIAPPSGQANGGERVVAAIEPVPPALTQAASDDDGEV